MRLVSQANVIEVSAHRPTLNREAVTPFKHAHEIESGFREAYDLLERHRAELLATGAVLERFADDEVRVVFRPTSGYAALLHEGAHPDVLRDALDRERLFDRLWDDVRTQPDRAALIPAEIEDLWRGDIPYFATRPRSRDLTDSSGRCRTHAFAESGLDRVRRRIERLGADDFARQRWFLRASLATLHAGSGATVRSTRGGVEGGLAVDRDRLIAASCAVADRLAETALRGNGEINWIGLTPVREEKWSLLPLGADLYDGLPGVALFFGYLGAVTGQERHTALARCALAALRLAIHGDTRQISVRSIGVFTGWGGILYTLAHLGTLWSDPELLAEADRLVPQLPDLIANDNQLDLLDGAAGCLVGLLCLQSCRPSSRVLEAAIQCGEHLLERAQPMAVGVAWSTSSQARAPLTGLSHGAAGIASALAELASETGDERFRAAALDGIAYERSVFSLDAGNWPDLRGSSDMRMPVKESSSRFTTTWCHGAPGIGLARLRCLPSLDDPQLKSEIEIAVKTTLTDGFGSSHSLCHGDLGNLELLLCTALADSESTWRLDLDRLTARTLDEISRDGWKCANPLGVETPGLMTGIAGIGYALLRLAEPLRVPSVLSLAPPPRR